MSASSPQPNPLPPRVSSPPTMRLASPFSGLETFVSENAPLARFTWYKIGGPARYLIRPHTVQELQ